MILNMKAYLSHDGCITDRAQHGFTSGHPTCTLQFAMGHDDEDGETTEGMRSTQMHRRELI